MVCLVLAGSVRRIQATGGGSYVITLPKDWVKRFGLESGGEVLVEYTPDGSLRVRPLSSTGGQRLLHVGLDAGDNGAEELLRWIVSYYISGVDVIEISVGKRSGLVHELVPLVSSRLMGVEVVEESWDRIVFQVVVDPASMPLDRSFSRLARTVGYMLDDLARGIKGGDSGLLGSIPARDDVVDKLFIFVWRQVFLILSGRRLVRELGARSLPDAILVMAAAKNIERIGDHVSSIASAAVGLGGSCLQGLAGVVEEADRVYREATAVFTRPSRQQAEEAMRTCLAARARLVEGLRAACGGRAEEIHTVAHSLRRVVDYSTDIVELAMNRFAAWSMEGLEAGGGR